MNKCQANQKYSACDLVVGYWITVQYFVTARKRSLRRLCFHRCLSVHSGGGPRFLSRGSLSGGVSVWGGLCPGGLCPGGLCLGVGLCPWGVSVRKNPPPRCTATSGRYASYLTPILSKEYDDDVDLLFCFLSENHGGSQGCFFFYVIKMGLLQD